MRPTTTPLTSSWTSLMETQPLSPSTAAYTKVRFENQEALKQFPVLRRMSSVWWTILNTPSSLPDPESVLKSKRGIEDKLVEEYRNCHHYRQTKAELGTYDDEVTEFISSVSNLQNLLQQTVLTVF